MTSHQRKTHVVVYKDTVARRLVAALVALVQVGPRPAYFNPRNHLTDPSAAQRTLNSLSCRR